MTYKQTDKQTDYCNPSRPRAPRVNNTGAHLATCTTVALSDPEAELDVALHASAGAVTGEQHGTVDTEPSLINGHLHVYMCACVHECMHACVREQMCACVHEQMCACVHVCMCACVHVHMCTSVCMHVCMSACACVYVCMCTCVYSSKEIKHQRLYSILNFIHSSIF